MHLVKPQPTLTKMKAMFIFMWHVAFGNCHVLAGSSKALDQACRHTSWEYQSYGKTPLQFLSKIGRMFMHSNKKPCGVSSIQFRHTLHWGCSVINKSKILGKWPCQFPSVTSNMHALHTLISTHIHMSSIAGRSPHCRCKISICKLSAMSKHSRCYFRD